MLPSPSNLNYYMTLTVSQKAKLFGPGNHLLKSTTERYPTSCCLKSLGVVFLIFQEVSLAEFAYGKLPLVSFALNQNVKILVSAMHVSPGLWAAMFETLKGKTSGAWELGDPGKLGHPDHLLYLTLIPTALLGPHSQPLPVLALSNLPRGFDLQMSTALGTAITELVAMMWGRNSVDSDPSCLLSWCFITTESLMYLLKLIRILKTDSIL